MLGALGDVNKIEDPAIHASVFEHLCDLQDTLQRVSLYPSISMCNVKTQQYMLQCLNI